jgi:TonB family protein
MNLRSKILVTAILSVVVNACASTPKSKIDSDGIDTAIKKHRDQFLICHEQEVNAGRTKNGKIIAGFVIGSSGNASQTTIVSSSMDDPIMDRCVLDVITGIQFPPPAAGVPVTIKYPFNFGAK